MNKNIHHPPDYSSVPQDNLILEHYGINELNFESIKIYREKFSAIKPDHPWNGLEMKEFLYKIGAWGKVRNTNQEGLTLAGLLMFSEERIITEVLPQYFLEYRENLEESLTGDWSKRFTSQDGTWSGNVFDFYFKTSTDLEANFNILDKNHHFSHSHKEAAIPCLHESLINTLVHADYYGEGGIVIEKEKNLFRFSNPGLFRISVDQALEGNISNLRNPNLFKMFILIGLCKRTGSGLKNIHTIWKQFGDNAFDLIQDSEAERTILTLYAKINTSEENANLEEIIEESPFLFSEREHQNENIDNSMSSVTKKEDSYNKIASSYNNEMDKYNSINKSEISYNNDFYSYNKEENSVNNGDNSGSNEDNSCNKENSDNSEIHVKNTKEINLTSNLENEYNEKDETFPSSKEIEEELWEISELARRKKRLHPNVMEEIIVRLCSKKPLMLRELANLLERTPDGLRNNYLAKLLTKGRIKLKYPDQINHPKQAYIFVEKKEGERM